MLHFLAKYYQKKVQNDYNLIAESFSSTRNKPWEDWKHLEKYFTNNKTILDIGCGNGRLSQAIIHNKYYGIDISKNLIKIANQKFSNQKIKFQLGSFKSIPYPNQKFDISVSIAAFHHLPSVKSRKIALKELKRVTKKDGILIFSVWNLLNQSKYKKERRNAFIKSLLTLGVMHPRDLFIAWKKGENKLNRYYYAFTVKEVLKLVENNGFELIEVLPLKQGVKTDVSKSHNIYFVCKRK